MSELHSSKPDIADRLISIRLAAHRRLSIFCFLEPVINFKRVALFLGRGRDQVSSSRLLWSLIIKKPVRIKAECNQRYP